MMHISDLHAFCMDTLAHTGRPKYIETCHLNFTAKDSLAKSDMPIHRTVTKSEMSFLVKTVTPPDI